MNKMTICPACFKNTLDKNEVSNSLSRFASMYICNDCGMREALEGNFWHTQATPTNFDLRITKEQAEYILSSGLNEKHNFQIMCKEYGEDTKDESLEHDWIGLEKGDLDEEDGTLSSDLETFELWFA